MLQVFILLIKSQSHAQQQSHEMSLKLLLKSND